MTEAGWDQLRGWLPRPVESEQPGRSELLLKLFFGRHASSGAPMAVPRGTVVGRWGPRQKPWVRRAGTRSTRRRVELSWRPRTAVRRSRFATRIGDSRSVTAANTGGPVGA